MNKVTETNIQEEILNELRLINAYLEKQQTSINQLVLDVWNMCYSKLNDLLVTTRLYWNITEDQIKTEKEKMKNRWKWSKITYSLTVNDLDIYNKLKNSIKWDDTKKVVFNEETKEFEIKEEEIKENVSKKENKQENINIQTNSKSTIVDFDDFSDLDNMF